MLELARKRVPSEPKGFDFFRRIAKYIQKQGGVILYGEDEEILERTYARDKELSERIEKSTLEEWIDLFHEKRYVNPHTERDPHFIKVAIEQQPEIILLGRCHIPYLVKKYYAIPPNRLVYIPTEE